VAERFVAQGGIAELIGAWWAEPVQAAQKPPVYQFGQGELPYQGDTGPGIFTKTGGAFWEGTDREPAQARLPEERLSWWEQLIDYAGKYGQTVSDGTYVTKPTGGSGYPTGPIVIEPGDSGGLPLWLLGLGALGVAYMVTR